MNNFDFAINHVLKVEGGYVNHKNDKGGATNYGISLRFLKGVDDDLNGDGHVDKFDIAEMTQEQAIDLYRKYFWLHYRLDEIDNKYIAAKCFDIFVNMRGRSAAKIVQRACNHLLDPGNEFYCPSFNDRKLNAILEDGILGSGSIGRINLLSRHVGCAENLLAAIRYEQAEFYKRLVSRNPGQAVFLKGWLRRAES